MSISAMDGTEYCIVFLSFLIDIDIKKKESLSSYTKSFINYKKGKQSPVPSFGIPGYVTDFSNVPQIFYTQRKITAFML